MTPAMTWRSPRWPLLALLLTAGLQAQQSQNPSPMVEHTRSHPRLKPETPAGRRFKLDIGELFLPAKLKGKSVVPLLIHFHGSTWLPEVAAARNGDTAVISVQLGSGSGVYARAFAEPGRFAAVLKEAEKRAGVKWKSVALSGWSAGCAAIREILGVAQNYTRVSAVLLIDGIHSGYVNGQPGPLESELEPDNLKTFIKVARDAVAGKKRMIITHTEIFPGTFASTTETMDYLLSQIGLRRQAVLKWGPVGTQQLSEVRKGQFLMLGYAGNSAPDHVDQLHALPDYLKRLR